MVSFIRIWQICVTDPMAGQCKSLLDKVKSDKRNKCFNENNLVIQTTDRGWNNLHLSLRILLISGRGITFFDLYFSSAQYIYIDTFM